MNASYQQVAPGSSPRPGTDVAAWALVALIVAAVCAFAGWAVAQAGVPGSDDVARQADLAAREGATRGLRDGYASGVKAGSTEASLRTRQQVAQARRSAQSEGYAAGFGEGRSRAALRAGDYAGAVDSPYAMAGAPAAYPASGYEDVLASGAFGDVPGYADSAYSASGYGLGTSTPYASGGVYGSSTSLGDDSSGFGGLGY